MTRIALTTAAALLALAAGAAPAADHAFQIDEVYSNPDGSIQFIRLHEPNGQSGQDQLAGQTLTVTGGGRTHTFTFPSNLPHPNSAYHYVLIATQGYLSAPGWAPEYALVTPDYVVPDRFLPTENGTIDYAGIDQMPYPALPTDGFSAVYRSGAVRDNVVQDYGGVSATLQVVPVYAIEYYNVALDHYFVSDLEPDLEALDSGRIAGWSRTGQRIRVWPSAGAFRQNVCRYYIPPQHGDSHFFSASQAECAAIASFIGTNPNYSGYVLETSEAFAVALPDSDGTCAYSWRPVYRLWNNRADSNHRYTTDPAIKAQMIARGYIAEGYGADAVAMCVPNF